MIAEAGHYALVLALGLALIQAWYRLLAPACTIRPR
jgi:cytochrome c biogenesis factor